ncbi:RloB family protein [Streptomyces sp. NPDC001415]
MARAKGKESLGAPARGGRRKKVVYVFTEGKETEPSFLDIIWERHRESGAARNVDMRIANRKAAGSHRKPLTLVEDATRTMREKTREAKKAKTPLPEVWVLFDRDQHEHIQKAMSEAEAAGVKVAFSHPCFEVWRLLHHKDVSGSFGGVCGLATERLPFAQTSLNIKVVQPDEIPKGSYTKARDRALKMNAQHHEHVPRELRDPYTDVHAFVETGLGITTY